MPTSVVHMARRKRPRKGGVSGTDKTDLKERIAHACYQCSREVAAGVLFCAAGVIAAHPAPAKAEPAAPQPTVVTVAPATPPVRFYPLSEKWWGASLPEDHDRPEPDMTFDDPFIPAAVTGTASTSSGWNPNYPPYGD